MGVSLERLCNKNSWRVHHLFPVIISTIESDKVFSVELLKKVDDELN